MAINTIFLLFLFFRFCTTLNVSATCQKPCDDKCDPGYGCVDLRGVVIKRCCEIKHICVYAPPTFSQFQRQPCEEGTELRFSEKLNQSFCCPSIHRFYSFFGPENSQPIWSQGFCSESTPDCSCEPIYDRMAPLGLARDENWKVVKMCFDPKDIPPNIHTESLFAPCFTNSDCPAFPNAYCHGQELNWELYDEALDETVQNAGFCQSDSPFLDPFPSFLSHIPDLGSSQGTLTVHGTNCGSHVECVEAGRQKEFEPRGVNYCNQNTTSGKGVCQLFQTRPDPCYRNDSPVLPLLYCENSDTVCQEGSSAPFEYYCGKGGVCCQVKEPGNSLKCEIGEQYGKCWRGEDCKKFGSYCAFSEDPTEPGVCCQTKYRSTCPDTVTDPRHEQSCYNASCPTGSFCILERCCPFLTYNRTSGEVSEIPTKSYYTNQPCTMSLFEEHPAVRAFCDPETKKYVIIGKEMDYSNDTTELEVNNWPCKRDKDCNGVNLVCVRTFSTGVCFHHPAKLRIAHSRRHYGLINFFGSLAFIGILTMIFMGIIFKNQVDQTFWNGIKYLLTPKLKKYREHDKYEREYEYWINELSGPKEKKKMKLEYWKIGLDRQTAQIKMIGENLLK